MDIYCKKRYENQKLPALSINLGAIGGCGMIQQDNVLANTMISNGINFTIYYELFNKIKQCLFNHTLYNVCITDQTWNTLNSFKTNYLFKNYLDSSSEKSAETINVNLIKEELVDYIKNLLDIDNEISLDNDLLKYGVDSLISTDIANWCKNNMNINIKQIDILQGITINQILSKIPNVIIKLDTKKKNIFYYESTEKFMKKQSKTNSNYINYLYLPCFFSVFYLIWNIVKIIYT